MTEFRLRPGLRIGAATAEEDSTFLHTCFVDTGLLARLQDVTDPACIVLGRTGSGKTALVTQLRSREENIIEIDAETLSFNYIANSDIIRFFMSIGVNLDLFFRLLWQHILTIEMLRYKYQISDRSRQQRFLETIKEILLGDSRKRAAIDYLQKYGDSFWLETGVRAREITSKFEEELKASAGMSLDFAKLSVEGADTLSIQEKHELTVRAQKVVNNVQVRELAKVIEFLAEDVFSDRKDKLFIIIDRLDETWAGDVIRYKITRSLLECVRKFRHVSALKIVICIRNDLLDRVISETRQLGFQSEKYEDFYLKIRWSHGTLRKLMDLRVNQLVRESYTKKEVGLQALFPAKIGTEPVEQYIVQRTFLRPRDAIIFVNTVLERSAEKVQISAVTIREAETAYSRGRLSSLCEEWTTVHPSVEACFKLLTRWRNGAMFRDIPAKVVHEIALEIAGQTGGIRDELREAAENLVERGGDNHESFARTVICILYKVGALGIKSQTFRPTVWSESDEATLSRAEIAEDSRIYVHKALHSALGVILQ